MDSDNDSNDGPIHRRRTQGTRPPNNNNNNNNNTSANPMHRMSTPAGAGAAAAVSDRSYHPSKDEGPYSDDDELEEEDDEHPAPAYRGRGRPSQQHLMDSSYDDGDDLPRYTGPLREQDRFLPIANVAKIMKKGVPEKGKIAKDAKETIQECVSEFISFITSEASDRCLQEKRKTINGEDILLAMLTLGFDSYVEPLRTFLTKVRDASKYDRTITMGGDLTEEIRMQVNQPGSSMAQAQVATTVQVQPATNNNNTTTTGSVAGGTSQPVSGNGLEPYGHSVRVVTCIRNDQPGENPNYVYTIQPYQ